MRKSIATLLAGAALIGLSGTAAARVDVGISLGIPAPVYYAPRPVYAPPPVYYAPAPVYYAPAPVYYAPPAPVYYGPPAVVYGGRGWHRGWNGHHHGR
jgi:PXPV repeat-containing protein